MKIILTIIALLIFNSSLFASEKTATEFIKEIQNAYANQENFSCQVKVISIDHLNGTPMRETSTDLLISLKKPNYFLISWVGKTTGDNDTIHEGVAWNDGEKSYIYDKTGNSYFSFNDFERALAFSGQYTDYVSYKIPALFINQLNKANWLTTLTTSGFNVINEKDLILNNEDLSQNPIKKFEIKLFPKNHFISNMATVIIHNRTTEDRIASLKSKKDYLLKNFDNYKSLLGSLDVEEQDDILSELIETIDKKIEKQKRLPNQKNVQTSTTTESFYNFNIDDQGEDKFHYKLPNSTKYLGDKVEKAINKLN